MQAKNTRFKQTIISNSSKITRNHNNVPPSWSNNLQTLWSKPSLGRKSAEIYFLRCLLQCSEWSSLILRLLPACFYNILYDFIQFYTFDDCTIHIDPKADGPCFMCCVPVYYQLNMAIKKHENYYYCKLELEMKRQQKSLAIKLNKMCNTILFLFDFMDFFASLCKYAQFFRYYGIYFSFSYFV